MVATTTSNGSILVPNPNEACGVKTRILVRRLATVIRKGWLWLSPNLIVLVSK